MQKLIGAAIMLALLTFMNQNAFSAVVCQFDQRELKIDSIVFEDEQLVIDDVELVELSTSRIRCGSFGKQFRFDGQINKNLQIVLKSCTDMAALEGHVINTKTNKVTEITCD